QEAVGEPTGRGAEVEAVLPARIDAEHIESMGELLAAARHEPRRTLDGQRRVVADLLTRFGVPRHEPGHDERLRLLAALGEPALHEHHVEPLLRHGYAVRTASPSTSSASTDVSASIASRRSCARRAAAAATFRAPCSPSSVA